MIAIVARIIRGQLGTVEQVVFFRALGRTYGKVGASALGVALAGGAVLLRRRRARSAALCRLAIAVVTLVLLARAAAQAA